jgi:hypothetical protein
MTIKINLSRILSVSAFKIESHNHKD